VRLSTWAFGLAALGAVLAMAALLVPAYMTTRKSMLHYRQNLSRPPGQPVFLRYYLDLAVVGVAAYAFYQLQNRGSLVTDRLFGGLTADPLLLMAPTLFMLMVALVFLRVFPLVLGVRPGRGGAAGGDDPAGPVAHGAKPDALQPA
jgi:putative ABC transport system permease protein